MVPVEQLTSRRPVIGQPESQDADAKHRVCTLTLTHRHQVVEICEHSIRAGKKPSAGFGEFHPAAGTQKQIRTEFAFEFLDASTERLRTDEVSLGGAPEM